jgi:NAD(P) transhydrogenase
VSTHPRSFDVVVIGSGPGGLAAAIEAADARLPVCLIERDARLGGACVHRGTIPSKTLHEMARRIVSFRRLALDLCGTEVREDLEMATLVSRLEGVVDSHVAFMEEQVRQAGISLWHGRAAFADPHTLEVAGIDGTQRRARGEVIIVATGSRPRTLPGIPIDHEHILDSDSILSLAWLPASLTVLGAGVIAAEYATIFAHLGVRVTMIDKAERPLGFLDPELTGRLVQTFEQDGGRFLGGHAVASAIWDGVTEVVTTLDRGETVRSEKVLVALGRVANLEGLQLEKAGLSPEARGLLKVDASCRTTVPHIYAVGDVIGPPALASCSLEQGRRAVRAALGLEPGSAHATLPVGIYTQPELASVGLSEPDALKQGGCMVGRAPFEHLARGQISSLGSGLLKLVADRDGRKLLGAHVIGEGASELIHIGQMALLAGFEVDAFVRNVFNFPTLAEAYRVAALDIVRQRGAEPLIVTGGPAPSAYRSSP